jgi:hypothetical protein
MRSLMKVSTLASPSVAAPVTVFVPQANQWVQLRERLPEYSADQALLLCEENEGRWVAWVPDYGQALLEREQLLNL